MHYIGPKRIYRREMTRLINGANALGIPIEINMLGMRERKNYPNPNFWALAGELGASAILGCDAHSPEYIADCFFENRY